MSAPTTPLSEAELEAAMRSLSAISATLSESYTALERRAAHVEEELARKVRELLAPAMAEQLVRDEVDVAIMVPA